MRSSRGQATPEYVALVLVVAVVLGTAATVTSGGLGGAVAEGLRRGLCAVTGRACAARAVAGDLPPCLLRSHDERSELAVEVGPIDLGRGRSLRVARFSDGHVEVTFGAGGRAGLVAQIGGATRIGGDEIEAQAGAGFRIHVGSGETWRFPGARDAQAFLRRWAGRQTVLGGLVHDARALCLICRLTGHGPSPLPPADVVWHGAGHDLEASAGLRALGLGGRVAATMERQTVGVREERGGGRTRYLALGESLAGALTAVGDAHRRSGLVLELHEDRRGRPDAVALRAVAARGVPSGEALSETTWHLALRSPADVGAVQRLVTGGMWPRSTLDALLAVRPFLARVAAEGTRTERRLGVRLSHGGTGVAEGFHLGAGAAIDLEGADARLESEAVALPGRGLAPRDCGPA